VQRTPEDTVVLVRQLAREFDDAQIARILNKQGRRSGLGNPFTRQSVTSLKGKHRIAKSPETIAKDPFEGPFTADEAACELGVTMSTVHRWLREGGWPASSSRRARRGRSCSPRRSASVFQGAKRRRGGWA
jgi:DNA invertase Pin-like site-specific DNA recombinase